MTDYHFASRQQGFVASYLLVGVALLVVVGAGLYALHSRSQSTAPTSGSGEGIAVTGVSPSAKPEKSSHPASTDKTDHKTDKKTEVSPSPKPSSSKSPSTETSLPRTGPADTITSTLMLGVLVGLVVAYLRSDALRTATLKVDEKLH